MQVIKYYSSRLEIMHSLGQRLAMSTAAGSVMPQSQLRLLYLFLKRHVHELEEQVNKTVLRQSPLHLLHCLLWLAGISPGLLFAAGAVWTGDQEGCLQVRAKQQARPCSISSSCLSHRCQKI